MRLKDMNSANLIPDFRILILDDEELFVKSKVYSLRKKGFCVDGTSNVYEAIDSLRENRYDLLILDYLMPEMRGDKVVELIRTFDKELYILLLTGYSESPALEIMERLDITNYCEKSDDDNRLLVSIKSAIKSVRMTKTIQNTRDKLSKILESTPLIYQLLPLNEVLEKMLIELLKNTDSSDAFILIDNIRDDAGNIINQTVFKGVGKYESFYKISNEILEYIGFVRTKNTLKVVDNSIIIPLSDVNNRTLGVILIDSENKEDESLKILQICSSLISSSISNSILHSMLNLKNLQLNEQREKLALWYIETVKTIRATIDAKDSYTCGHSDRVSMYSMNIGKALELRDSDLVILREGGIFHDIGKIGTDDNILKKTGTLDNNEFYEIQKHPERGAMILSAISMFKDVVPLVLYHHERFDGKGYPYGIKGKEIPFMARILTVSDAFDAMTTDRCYRPKKTVEEALIELKKGSGTQFDKRIVDCATSL
ncbi:MAG TPA: HD domain-containing response regulator, partial [Clostridia bacterium]